MFVRIESSMYSSISTAERVVRLAHTSSLVFLWPAHPMINEGIATIYAALKKTEDSKEGKMTVGELKTVLI